MPELPEVSNYSRVAARALGKRVTRAVLSRPRLLGGIAPARFPAWIAGKKFGGVARHGKFLFLRTGPKEWLALHFGLSGRLTYSAKPHAKDGGSLDVFFEDGSVLRYRGLFGRIDVIGEPAAFVKKLGLGKDALDVTPAEFRALLLKRGRAPVKAVLMDQKTIAGVGNLYSDEALFRTGVHPLRPAADIGPATALRIHRELRKILLEVTKQRAKGEWLFPKGYLAPHREPGEPCPRCGTPLKMVPSGGRKAFYCPREQKK